MNLVRSFTDLPPAALGGAVSIGNFDGVHRGHAWLLGRLRKMADHCGGPAVVFTFSPHPAAILRPGSLPPPLTWLERKAFLLAELGVDWVIAYPTDAAVLALNPREFFDRIICRGLKARAMVEGPNFFFGKDREGSAQTLRGFCGEAGLEIEIADPQQEGDDLISSSRIRDALLEGNVKAGAAMLGRPHRVRGEVVRGAERGRTIGFPTANLSGIECLLPADGVYACRASLAAKPSTADAGSVAHNYAAAVNIGPNPTFADGERKVEAYLLDFKGDIYGQTIELDFVDRLRGVVTFDSIDALKQQLNADVLATRELISAASANENE